MQTFLLVGTLISTAAIFTLPVSANQITAIDAAANTMNLAQLETLGEQSQDYDKAYANYRLAIGANILGQPTLASAALNKAQNQLEDLTQGSVNAENLALLASVYGMQIGLDTSKGAIYGPKVGTSLNQAQTLEPDNPRVLLIKAISAFNTPAAYGGSMENAVSLSSKAIDLFANPCDNICWGHAEAYTWRGLAKQNSGDKQGALDDWHAAVNVQTDYTWALFLLKQDRDANQ
ncbi:MAG: hypothetical protein COB74_04525 [Shewanella sp.]|nr:MAG: hypothetical protein COB74_04525 [Shewanella sp.]